LTTLFRHKLKTRLFCLPDLFGAENSTVYINVNAAGVIYGFGLLAPPIFDLQGSINAFDLCNNCYTITCDLWDGLQFVNEEGIGNGRGRERDVVPPQRDGVPPQIPR